MFNLIYKTDNLIVDVTENQTKFVLESGDNISTDFAITIKVYKRNKESKGKLLAKYSNTWPSKDELSMLNWIKDILEDYRFRHQFECGAGSWQGVVLMDDYINLYNAIANTKTTCLKPQNFKIANSPNISPLSLKLKVLNSFICNEDILALTSIFNNNLELVSACVKKIILGESFEDAVASIEKEALTEELI